MTNGSVGSCGVRLGRLAAGLVAAGAAASLGCSTSCEDTDAICGAAPAQEIVGFEVTVTTGAEPTDNDIYFCFRRDSGIRPECTLLDLGLFHNDFEAWETDTYRFSVAPIAPGDFQRFWLFNEFNGIHDYWSIDAINVDAILPAGGQVMIYRDSEITCDVEIGGDGSYLPRRCPY